MLKSNNKSTLNNIFRRFSFIPIVLFLCIGYGWMMFEVVVHLGYLTKK